MPQMCFFEQPSGFANTVFRLMFFILASCVGEDLYGESFKLVNSTNTSVTATLISVDSAGKQLSFGSSWHLEPGKSIDIAPTSNKQAIPVDGVSLSLNTRFGDGTLEVQFDKSSKRLVHIQPKHLPLIRKQSNFRTWTSKDGKFKCEAKLAQHYIADGIEKVQLLKSDGNLVTVNMDKLNLVDVKFIESVESGDNPIVWAVGSKFIYPDHLVGRQVTVVLHAQHFSGGLNRVEPEWIYGPIITGKIIEGRTKGLKYEEPESKRRVTEKESRIKIGGEIRFFSAGVLGTKEKVLPFKDQWLTFASAGVRKRNDDYSNSKIDSVSVGDLVYVPTKSQKLSLGSTEFWSKLKANEKIRVFPEGDEAKVKAARGIITLGALFGGLAVAAARNLDGPIDPPPAKEPFFSIKGRTIPDTMVYYGAGIGTYNYTRSDSNGYYQINSLIRPTTEFEYYLDIEVAGKRERKWTGKLNPNGQNDINLL